MENFMNFFFADWFQVNEATIGEDDYAKVVDSYSNMVKEFAQRAVQYAQDRPGYMTSDQMAYMSKLAEVGLGITSESEFEPAAGQSLTLPNSDLLVAGFGTFYDRLEKYAGRVFDKFEDFSSFLRKRLEVSNVRNLAPRFIDIIQEIGGMEKKGMESGEAGVASYDVESGEGGQTMAGQVGGMSDVERKERETGQIAAGEEREQAEGFFKVLTDRSKVCFANLYKQAQEQVAAASKKIYDSTGVGSNVYRNAAYAKYFAQYILNMIETNPEKYENILKKTLSVTISKDVEQAKKVKGMDVQNLRAYEAELAKQLERGYRKLPQFQKGGEGYERGAVSKKAAEDAKAQVTVMLRKNQETLMTQGMPEGSEEEDFLKVATQMTIDNINQAMGRKKSEKQAVQARFGKHVAGIQGIHTNLVVVPKGVTDVEGLLMSDFGQQFKTVIAKDMELLKALAVRAFLGLAGIARGTKGCMNVAQALENVPSIFRDDIRKNVNMSGADVAMEGFMLEQDGPDPSAVDFRSGKSCDQILLIRGTTDQQKLTDLVNKFFDIRFPSLEFKTVAQTNIIEKAIFGTIVASANAVIDNDKACDHPQFTFPFRGRHYDIEKGVKKEAISFDNIYENLKFKYEINRIVKEIINDIS
jgi:hypothetical protein